MNDAAMNDAAMNDAAMNDAAMNDAAMNDPIYQQAVKWIRDLLDAAGRLDLKEPTAVSLATSTAAGRPTARIVLMRGFDERGFVFYTNSQSRKGDQLAENPAAALCFYWEALGRQLRVEGPVEQTTDEESDSYWSQRHRGSQLAAWASQQSRELESPEVFDRCLAEVTDRYADGEVPRPEHWYGYRVVPRRIEFWSQGDHRMHERVVYEQEPSGWIRFLLFP